MSNDPKVFISILNWNGLKDTLECLDSVLKLDYPNFEVIVVDNASSDNSVEVIKKAYPQIILIENENNLGFTGGNNIAMRYAMAHDVDYIWLLNNDAIVETDTLSKLIAVAESSTIIGLVSPMIYHFDNPNEVQFAGGYIDWKTFSIKGPGQFDQVGKEFQSGNNVCLWGTALLVKRSMVEKTGYLKEEYFAYAEDNEYSLRAIVNGFQNRVCTTATIFHKNPSNPTAYAESKGPYYDYFKYRNNILLADEYIESFAKRLGFKIKVLAELSYYMGCRESKNIEACLDGAWHGLTSISGEKKDNNKMPIIVKKSLLFLSKCHPVFLSDLIRFDFKEVYRKIVKKRFLA